jgi:phosphoribosylaminoimidazolecarboxamide formyltransferase/IMP cyclohydrolase
MRIGRALLSVWDKAGVVELARGLAALGWEIVSTGGTAGVLREAGVRVEDLAGITGVPELLGGRVKTLHPAVYAGLLARRDRAEHMADLARREIRPIDLVAVTLYPFEAAVRSGADLEAALEHIDIGGVALLRAAAKNFADVVVLTDPAQYAPVLDELRTAGGVRPETRRRLALAAFTRTSGYDAAIAAYLAHLEAEGAGDAAAAESPFPDRLVLAFEKRQDLRYGENPHQKGAFYREPGAAGASVAGARQIAGKALSYNNIYDLDTALELVRELSPPAAVIVKHAIPCGVGTGEALADAYRHARDADPVSAFGGIVALNRAVDVATAGLLVETFLEAVIAPAFPAEALAVLQRKKNLRLMETGPLTGAPGARPGAAPQAPGRRGPGTADWDLRRVRGGLLVQERDSLDLVEARLRTVTTRVPTDREWADLRFAWTVCRYVRSNAVVLARDRQVVGVGAGQMNRVEPVRLAVKQAGARARGAAMASEAFFPFPDAVEEAAKAGVTAVIHPGGSIRDAEVIAAAEAAGMAMVTTGIRHFRH